MKQYRITSDTFRSPGDDPTIPDAYIDPAVLAEVKKSAGIDSLGIMARIQSQNETASMQVSVNKAEYQARHGIKPGTDEWFKLWFARTNITNENPTPRD